MYGYGGNGIRPMRPQVADDEINQIRARRASRDQRMAPPSVTPMPEALPPPPQQGKGMAAQMLDAGMKMYAQQAAENSDDENQEKALEQMKTPSFVPPSAGQQAVSPSPPPMVRMPTSQAASPMPVRPTQTTAQPQMMPTQPALPSRATYAPEMPLTGPSAARPMMAPETETAPQMQNLPATLTAPDMPSMAPQRPRMSDTADPIEKARQEAVYGGQMQADIGLKPKRSFWDTLKTAGVGALHGMASGGGIGGAIGGALAGGITSAISPEAGRDYRFDILQRPRMEQEQDRQARRAQQIQALIKSGADVDLIKAQTGKTRAETETLPGRARLDEETRRSQMDVNQARAENYRNPRPKYTPEEEARLRERHDAEMQRIKSVIERNKRPSSRGGGGGGGRRSSEAGERNKPTTGATAFARTVEEALQNAREKVQKLQDLRSPGNPATPDVILNAEREAEMARDDYERLVNDLGSLYPEDYETGQGTQVGPDGKLVPIKGWPYFKARARGGR